MVNGRYSLPDHALAAGPLNWARPAAPTQILLPLGDLGRGFGQPANPGSPKMKPKSVPSGCLNEQWWRGRTFAGLAVTPVTDFGVFAPLLRVLGPASRSWRRGAEKCAAADWPYRGKHERST
jgi:hypothetical protein